MELENNNRILEEGSVNVEKFWVEKQLPKEIETLPYEILTEREKEIIDKYHRGEELTQDEINIIKKSRSGYQNELKKYDVNKIIQSHEILEENLGTEQELLDLVFNKEKPVIKMLLPINGEEKLFKFTVKPLDDSRAVKLLEQHVDIFKDLSQEERIIYNKGNAGEKLNPKEEAILKHINEKINENASISRLEGITDLLAAQLEEPVSLTYEQKLEFWGNFNFMLRMGLYAQVMKKLGLDEEFNDRLFPD